MEKMVLVLTNEQDLHSDIVIQELVRRGELVRRVNTDRLPGAFGCRSQIGDDVDCSLITYAGGSVPTDAVKSVWYRKPTPPRSAERFESSHREFVERETREALNGYLLELREKVWVNPYWRLDAASNKLLQLRRAQKLGFAIPRTLMTEDPEQARAFYERCKGRMIYKTLYSPVLDYPHGSTIVRTHSMQEQELPSSVSPMSQPCLFQERVQKLFEIRVTVVGERIFAAELHTQDLEVTKVDWRRPEGFHQIKYAQHQLPKEIQAKLVEFLSYDNLIYGAFDFIYTPDHEYVFLENNPNGEWLWIQINTALPIAQALAEVLVASSG